MTFQLSESGNLAAQSSSMTEYLRAYDFPSATEARYGSIRIDSPQAEHRVSLFGQAWVPGHAVGTVAIIHGYSEHAGNYARLVRDFVSQQFAVITVDLRGHGLSEGAPSHAEGPHTYRDDCELILGEIFKQLLPNRPFFLWGHSMGAMVVLQLMLNGKLPVAPKGAVLTSPLVGFPELSGLQKVLSWFAPLLAKLMPTLPVAHGLPPETLSHDRLYLEKRSQDPLIRRNTTPRWFLSTKKSVMELQAAAPRFSPLAPTLLMLAGQEKVTNLAEARRFAHRAFAGQRHKVIEFPDAFHELEKEPAARARVLAESLAWFREHLN